VAVRIRLTIGQRFDDAVRLSRSQERSDDMAYEKDTRLTRQENFEMEEVLAVRLLTKT